MELVENAKEKAFIIIICQRSLFQILLHDQELIFMKENKIQMQNPSHFCIHHTVR